MRNKLFIFAVLIPLLGAPIVRGASDVKGPPADQVLRQLLEGNDRFVAHNPAHPDALPSDASQHPLAVVLSCSDSRVPPELAFDQGVGKLFVVRVAGNTYDRLALESIEYAIGHLGVGVILVIGHDQCGAVTAAVKSYPDANVGPMLRNIYPAVQESRKKPGDAISNAIDENAILIAKRLSSEAALAKLVSAHELRILPARYNLATGKVRILDNQGL
jgi:carbonic anhydrase